MSLKAKIINSDILHAKIVTGGNNNVTADVYKGEYTVTPGPSEQILKTKDLVLRKDVTVKAIPDEYVIPKGTLEVTENGVQDVTEYESVSVKIPNSSDLPDWDDDSPIIARGYGNYTCVRWELTKNGTMRWRYVEDGSGNGVYARVVGWNNTVNTGTQASDYMAVASKIKQMDIGAGFNNVYLGYAANCKRIRCSSKLQVSPQLISFGVEELDLSDYSTLRSYTNLPCLKRVVLNTSISVLPTFANCFSLSEINLGHIKVFGPQTLSECLLMRAIVFNKELESLGNLSFQRTHVKSIRFQNPVDKLPSIAANAFGQCNNLTDIYCSWPEDAVANAPWGATKATIHYNYVEEENINAGS